MEESIDRAMDRGYAGGEFKYRHGGRLPPAVIGELRRRYNSWLLAVRLDGCPDEDGTDTILAFKPGRAVPPQGDSGTDGPWLGSNPWE